MRTLICGGPKTGKTTLAKHYANVKHTDDLISTHEWSKASEEASKWLEDKEYTIEGVAAIRALRKWKISNPDKAPPVDQLIVLSKPKLPLNIGQQRIATSVKNIVKDLEPWLKENKVMIKYG